MNNTKAIICTSGMTAMLVVIMAGLLLLQYTAAFVAIAGVFAAVGMATSAGALFRWLAKPDGDESEPDVPAVFSDPVAAEVSDTVDDIIREMRGAE